MGLDAAIVKRSFEVLKPQANQFVDRFYQNLFADFPLSKPLFKGVDMSAQRQALFDAFAFVIANLGNDVTLLKYLRKMGERHLGYGIKSTHYEWIGKSLHKTLQEVLGSTFDQTLQHQWTLTFDLIAETMINAANDLEVAINEPSLSFDIEPSQVVEFTPPPRAAIKYIEDISVSLPTHVIDEVKAQARSAVRTAIQELFDATILEEAESLLKDGKLATRLKKSA